jgi:site-specific DNA-methyltransferase (adenine-specific)
MSRQLKAQVKRLSKITNMLLQGDCLTQLQNLEANSVDSIVTDPPYGLGFMGKQWDSLPPGQEVFEQCLRVLKPGGHLLCFGGSRTYHRMAVAVEDAGFEIRDQIMWVYGSGFPKSQNIGAAVDKIQGNERDLAGYDQSGSKRNSMSGNFTGGNYKITQGHSKWEGYGTALKPAHEPIVLARKPIEKGLSIAQNCLKWGVGAINVDGCRIGTSENLNGGAYSNTRREDDKFFKGLKPGGAGEFVQPSGRFPANFIHDGSDEVVGLFPVTAPSKSGVRNQKARPLQKAKGEEKARKGTKFGHDDDGGSAARFFYTAKANKKERLTFNNHPTVKPVSLMQYLVRLITPAGGTCLDPFTGSGTTGLACIKEGRGYVLIEADSQSLDIARRRLLSEIASQEWPMRNYKLI